MTRAWLAYTVVMILAGVSTLFWVFLVALSSGKVSLAAAGVAVLFLMVGSVALYVRERPRPDPPTRPHVHIDWAMSDICLTVTCPCTPGAAIHADGYSFGRLRCPNCRSRYQLPNLLEAYELTE